MKISPKSKFIIFNDNAPSGINSISLGNIHIERVSNFKYLGFNFS